jgi:ketosteroid isomerase-like protein
MQREDIARWAQEWIDWWNDRDIDAMLAHYREDVRFESPIAELVTGSALVEGKTALRTYWQRALERIRPAQFVLERTIYDPDTRELAIVYVAELDGRRTRVCELIAFDAAGRVIRSDAWYGACSHDRAATDAVAAFLAAALHDEAGGT